MPIVSRFKNKDRWKGKKGRLGILKNPDHVERSYDVKFMTFINSREFPMAK